MLNTYLKRIDKEPRLRINSLRSKMLHQQDSRVNTCFMSRRSTHKGMYL